MKYFLAVFSLCFSSIIFAQTNRFIYQVTMRPDSTDRATKSEIAHLDISGTKSVFYAENRIKRDSLFSRARETGSLNFDRNQMQNLRTNLDFIIEKDMSSQKISFEARIMRDAYIYQEDSQMNWKILPETTKIGDYSTQKAELEFGGRTWFAWFTTEIPFQDGPYKFSGLPGLIVKVEDSKGDYSFDLKETKKVAAPATFERRGQAINVKRTAFLKQQEQFRKNPASQMGQQRMSFQPTSDPNQRKQMEDRMKQEFSKNNNPIELK